MLAEKERENLQACNIEVLHHGNKSFILPHKHAFHALPPFGARVSSCFGSIKFCRTCSPGITRQTVLTTQQLIGILFQKIISRMSCLMRNMVSKGNCMLQTPPSVSSP
jgi:hypothetical protein